MYKAIVFAGTTEGIEICRFLSEHHILSLACVATEYGMKSLKEDDFLKIQGQRLNVEEMQELFQKECPQIVLDATHPYAAEVTSNIKAACKREEIPYQRVLREESGRQDQAIYVESTEAAVKFLEKTEGNVLLTTGSKELAKFTVLKDFQQRLYARVLSLPSVIEECRKLGFEGKHLIAMQGPFSMEMNMAMLHQYDCRYLVTKESGKAGGFQEKIDAAFACGAVPVIIGRPEKEEGFSTGLCKKMLAEKFGFELKSDVTLLGIGMGSRETMTLQGIHALEKADLVIGAKRMVDAVKMPHHHVLYEYRSEAIVDYIRKHPEFSNVVIALSGDVGFYSGARKLAELLEGKVEIISGISSVAYFMAKIGLSWDDARIVSAHGRNCNLVSMIRNHKKVFAILGTRDGVAELSKKLEYYGMGQVHLFVGENLSYENEKIIVKAASELQEYEGDALCVICAVNEEAEELKATHGIADEMFVRGKAPMTKAEVRCVSLSKLKLNADSICYDVGAGTGSVSVEMALRAEQGQVYAIEKNEEAVQLLYENKCKFAVDNLEITEGLAPDAMEELPAPTHAFIGGSSGNLHSIVEQILQKNPQARIVINGITLETVTEAMECIRKFEFDDTEIVQLGVSRSKTLGSYHMMMGENPIYIIACQKTERKKVPLS